MKPLPIFPLNTVLFSKQALPLHIFEERYKLMIGRCIDESAPFGVVLIKSGEEVGGDAVLAHKLHRGEELLAVGHVRDGPFTLRLSR